LLFAALMRAILGGATEKKAFAPDRLGRQLGVVFRIADDCKDY